MKNFTLKNTSNFLNKWGDFLSIQLERRATLFWAMAIFTLTFTYASSVIGISKFSDDSWSYFELSKTIFSDHFYQFNTIRSYFSTQYSASFPFGYPIVIAMVQAIVGVHPMVAVIINIAAATITIWVIFAICDKVKLPVSARLAIATALLFYPHYFDEIYGGRAIPLAILMFISAYYASLMNHFFITGILLGFSALIRFDFLAYAIVFHIAHYLFNRDQLKSLIFMFIGFLIGVLPWVAYSYIYFSKIWISDNSWVALSAIPANVLDYPAAPIKSAFEHPFIEITKLFRNLIRVSIYIIRSSLKFPLLFIFFIFICLRWKSFTPVIKTRAFIIISILPLSVAPYILTGYFDSRYFALLFLCLSGIIIYSVYPNQEGVFPGINVRGLTLLSLILTIAIGISFLSKDIWQGYNQTEEMKKQTALIKSIQTCHLSDPTKILFFLNDANELASKYGALTGMRTALAPSNFYDMNSEEKYLFLEQMKPYHLFNNLEEVQKCSSL